MPTPRLTAFLAAFSALFAAGARAQTDMVLVSTIAQTANAADSIAGSTRLATKFTVEPDNDYTLTSVTVKRASGGSHVDVAIHEEAGGNTNNPANTALYSLGRPGGRLAATAPSVSRVRTTLEGSRGLTLRGRLSLRPSVEVGLRHDAGDAETGAGLDLGAARARWRAVPPTACSAESRWAGSGLFGFFLRRWSTCAGGNEPDSG